MLSLCRRNLPVKLFLGSVPVVSHLLTSKRTLLTNHNNINHHLNHHINSSLKKNGILTPFQINSVSKSLQFFQWNQTRGFQKIIVKNRNIREFIEIAAKYSKFILVVYFGVIAAIVLFYQFLKSYFNQYNYLPTSENFSLYFKVLYFLGLFFSKIQVNYNFAQEFQLACLRAINDANNLPFDIQSDELDQFLSVETLEKKNLEYIHVYCDLLVRLAITKSQLGDNSDKILNLINKAIELSAADNYLNLSRFSLKSKKEIQKKYLNNIITFDLLANALIIKSNILQSQIKDKDNSSEIESLYLNALKLLKLNDPNKSENYKELLNEFNPLIHLNDEFSKNGGDILTVQDIYINKYPDTFLTRELIDYSNELGIYYSKTRNNNNDNLDKSLQIFLSNLKSIYDYQSYLTFDNSNNKNSFGIELPQKKDIKKIDIHQKQLIVDFNDVPRLKLYISEILWAKKFHNISIKWCQQVINDSYIHSRTDSNAANILQLATTNLIHMYQYSIDKKLVKDADSIAYYNQKIDDLKKSLSEIVIPINN